jgi:hypothetical protein
MADRYRVDPGKVVHETIEGEAILIHLDNGFYYSLDGAGAEIWGLLAESRSVDETAEALAREYDSDELAGEVRRIADELAAENLLEPTDMAPAAALNGDAPGERRAFTAPALKKYEDMQDFLLVDPIHETSDAGWPETRPEAS